MRFWVHGRALDEVETLGWLKAPLRDARAWIGEQVEVLREQYLMDRLDGEVVEEGIRHADKEHKGVVTQREGESARTAGTGWLDGLFGALNPSTTGGASSSRTRGGSGVGKRKALPPAGTYTSGEVHADFVKRAVVFWADPDEVAKEGLLEGSRTRLAW
ncbi:hypothetical protein QFC19_008047 [Naganishia cerealis]|uniref:Uncharacterized protein n=1 Tax=Naganishia cerealis TaxID=610337 RepID=A0ACC2V495_9TREE|nr:hypothetical protein QFC19_008047 [Naganishia cerealis]